MLTDKERQEQARLARLLQAQKLKDKARKCLPSGDAKSFLGVVKDNSYMAELGYHYCPNTSRVSHLKSEIKKHKPTKLVLVKR